jgi:ketosteroid isomerase-like protein
MDELLTADIGDCVVGHTVFQRRVTSPDGTRHEGEGRGTVVFRRGADGTLHLVIDHA